MTISPPLFKNTRRSSQERPETALAAGRNLSLDLLKALSILLVIFYHNGQLNPDSVADNLLMLIPNAAVPCFFMASGAVFFHRPFDMQKHLRRIVRFYLTIVAWKAIYMLLYWNWGAPVNGSLRALLSYLLLSQHLEGVGTAHFWFMDAMLTVMLVSPVLYLCYHISDGEETAPGSTGSQLLQTASFRLTRTNRLLQDRIFLPGHSRLLLFLLAVFVLFNQIPADGNLLIRLLSQWAGRPAWNISALGEVNPFSFRYSNYFTYYLLGALLIEYKETFSVRAAAVFTIIGTAGLLFAKYIQTGSLRWNGIYLESGYYWISTMVLAVGLFLLTSRLSVRERSLSGLIATHVGTSTLGIFYLHIPLMFALTPVLFAKLQAYNGWMVNLAESCLVVALSIPVIWTGRKIPGIRNLFR